ncbi:MAG: protein O-GlcNAcase, partial [Acholeplasmataceae bacterium]
DDLSALHTTGRTLEFASFSVDPDKKRIYSDPEVTIRIIKEPGMNDRYQVRFFSDYEVQIRHEHERGLAYAFRMLATIKTVMIGIYEGGPEFKIRGIIEGFYGKPWSHDDRLDALDFMRDAGMNAYFYAPKDDSYHRHSWRKLYPRKELSQLLELVERANRNLIDFYFSISPGNDFDYADDHEFGLLFDKIDQLLAHGVNRFALLLDDIDYELTGKNKERFKRPGLAHAFITNRLNEHLKKKLEDYVLVMCPTEYAQNWNTVYRKDLKETMDPDVLVFWTGYNTVAEYIPDQDGERVKKIFGHDLILWDNYPVNDMATDRIFLGPIVNRGKNLAQTHVGIIANPMVEWHLSKVSLLTMADYMWAPHDYDPDASYDRALRKLTEDQPELRVDLKAFTENNRDSLIRRYTVKAIDKAIEGLDMDALHKYFTQTNNSFARLKIHYRNRPFIDQAMPWFNRFDQDFALFDKIRQKTATRADAAYIGQAKHTLGSNVIACLSQKLGLYDGPIHRKAYADFWDDMKSDRDETVRTRVSDKKKADDVD